MQTLKFDNQISNIENKLSRAVVILYKIKHYQWRSKGRGTSGGTCTGAQALGAHRNINCSHLKRILSRNLDQSIPVGLQRLGASSELRPQTTTLLLPPAITTLSKFISSTICGLLPSKKNKLCIFQIFAAIFHFILCSFC